MNTANGEEFEYSQLKDFLPCSGFSGGSAIERQQLHLPCPAIIDSEVVSRELLGPPDLSGAQALSIHESPEAVVVSKDVDLVFAAF